MASIAGLSKRPLPILCVPDLHPDLVKFLQLPNFQGTSLSTRLDKLHAKLEFPQDKDGVLKVVCTLTVNDLRNYRRLESNQTRLVEKLISEWEQNVRKTLNETTRDLIVDDTIHCPVEIFRQLVPVLTENPKFNLKMNQGCALFIDTSSNVCSVVGERAAVKGHLLALQSEIDTLRRATYDKDDPITKHLGLSRYQVQFLEQFKFLDKKVPNCKMKLDTHQNSPVLIVSSKESVVDTVMADVRSILKGAARACIACTPIVSSLVQRPKTGDYINGKMQELKNNCIWYVSKDNDVVVLGRQLEKVEECKGVIQKSVKRKEVHLRDEKSNIFFTDAGQRELDRLNQEWLDFVEIREDTGYVQFAACENAFGKVDSAIRNLIEEKGIFSEFVEIPLGVLVYFREHLSEEYRELIHRCSENGVKIGLTRKAGFGFQLTGTVGARNIIKVRLKELVLSIRYYCHFMKGLGLNMVFLSEETLAAVKLIESTYRCVIDYAGRNLEKKLETAKRLPRSSSSSSSETRSETSLDDQNSLIQIAVVVGELAKQEVGIIVVNSNSKLELSNGAVSNRVLVAAGTDIQTECQTKYPEGIQIGQLAMTSSGNLKCSGLYHGFLLAWDGGNGDSERVMRIFLLKCLQKASESRVTSLAFPALGVEDMDYPTSFAASLMYECLDTFTGEHPDTTLKKITIVVRNEQECEEFRLARQGGSEPQRTVETSSCFLVSTGRVEVKFVNGDVTMETADAIILDSEYFSESGKEIRRRIESAKKSSSPTRLQQGISVTGADVMSCKHVYHVTGKTSRKAWRDAILACLKNGEARKLQTASISAFGINVQGLTWFDMGKEFLQVIKKFASSEPHCLRHIRFVLPSEECLGACRQAANNASNVTISDDVNIDFTVTIFGRSEIIEAVKGELNALPK